MDKKLFDIFKEKVTRLYDAPLNSSEYVSRVEDCLDYWRGKAKGNHTRIKKMQEWKKLSEEAYIISIFVENTEEEITQVVPVYSDGVNWDAEFIIKSCSVKVEVGYAIDGHNLDYTMKTLDIYGHAPVIDTKSLQKGILGNYCPENIAYSVSDIDKKIILNTRSLILKKISKNYIDTILLIGVDDYLSNSESLFEDMLEKFKAEFEIPEEKFMAVHLISVRKKSIYTLFSR